MMINFMIFTESEFVVWKDVSLLHKRASTKNNLIDNFDFFVTEFFQC